MNIERSISRISIEDRCGSTMCANAESYFVDSAFIGDFILVTVNDNELLLKFIGKPAFLSLNDAGGFVKGGIYRLKGSTILEEIVGQYDSGRNFVEIYDISSWEFIRMVNEQNLIKKPTILTKNIDIMNTTIVQFCIEHKNNNQIKNITNRAKNRSEYSTNWEK